MSSNSITTSSPTWWEQTADFRSDHQKSLIALSIVLLPIALLTGLVMAIQSGIQHYWEDRTVETIQSPSARNHCDGSYDFFDKAVLDAYRSIPSPREPWVVDIGSNRSSIDSMSFGSSPLSKSNSFSEFDLFESM